VLELVQQRPSVKLSAQGMQNGFTPDGHFLRMLAIACDERAMADPRIPSFETFLTSRPLLAQLSTPAKELGKILVESNSTLRALRDISIAAGKQSETKARDYLASPTVEGCISACDYLTYVLRISAPIVNIENIQEIDSSSLELILRATQSASQQYFLLEFTGTSEQKSLRALQDALANAQFEVALYPIERLKAEHVLRLIEHQPETIEGLVRNLYAKSTGSLRPLTDIYVNVRRDASAAIAATAKNFQSLSDFTMLTLDGLSSAERLVLAVVAIHGDWAECELIDRLTISSDFIVFNLDVRQNIASLGEQGLLESDAVGRIRCIDQNLVLVDNRSSFFREILLATKFWKDFYAKCLHGGDAFISKAEVLHYLVYLNFIEGDTLECSKVLNEALLLASKSFAPSRFITFSDQIRRRLRKEEQPELTSRINAQISTALQSLGYYDEALSIARSLPSGQRRLLYLSVLLENCGHAQEALEYAEGALADPEVRREPNVELQFLLAQFAALRALNRAEECEALFWSIVGEHRFEALPEFGYALRSAGSCLEPAISIPFLERSVRHFHDRRASVQEAYSRIELSVALAYSKKFDAAELELAVAEGTLDGQIGERHSIYNDRACLLIERKQTGPLASAFLRQALMTARAGFDRTAIQLNMLIDAALNSRSEDLLILADGVIRSCSAGGFSSRELVCLTYYNLAICYSQIGQDDVSASYVRQYDALRAELDISEQHPLATSSTANKDGIYKPVYLANWHIELVEPPAVAHE
jgi:hypothetical protein